MFQEFRTKMELGSMPRKMAPATSVTSLFRYPCYFISDHVTIGKYKFSSFSTSASGYEIKFFSILLEKLLYDRIMSIHLCNFYVKQFLLLPKFLNLFLKNKLNLYFFISKIFHLPTPSFHFYS